MYAIFLLCVSIAAGVASGIWTLYLGNGWLAAFLAYSGAGSMMMFASGTALLLLNL